MPNSLRFTSNIKKEHLLTFYAITLFYFFESAQMSYFNVLAPSFLAHGGGHHQIASISAAYYYGCMIGLLPVGFALDYFPLRKILLWAIFGSVIGAVLLMAQNFYLQWVARFICGFFGGTFSFMGGIKVLSNLFSNRFTFFMGLFLSAGMFGGLICQYPLLLTVNTMGIQTAIIIMAIFGFFVMGFNFFFLHPLSENNHPYKKRSSATQGNVRAYIAILKNYRNWLDCLMIVLLDTPVSIIGTLWGIVILMSHYHLPDGISAWIIMSLFSGLMVGLPLWGALADKNNYPAWIIIIGSGASFLSLMLMLIINNPSIIVLGCLFFGLGFFSSCQTLGFTWLTKNMRPELIGTNSALNSMVFMGTNGVFKQIGAYLLSIAPLVGITSSSGNLLILISGAMLFTTLYACVRGTLFNKVEKLFKEKLPTT